VTLAAVRQLARKRPEQEFFVNRLYGAHVSPFFTVACLRLGLTPDQVTILGGGIGGVGAALLFLPIGWWSLIGVAGLQVGYILDFSDGQVARMTGRTSAAGSYLDWLTHFYVPIGAALATATSVAVATGRFEFLVLGTLAALELGAFAFSGKEHVLIALARGRPDMSASAPFHAGLMDDATAASVVAARDGPADPSILGGGIAGRQRRPTAASIVGEILIYPGAAHLLTLAVAADLVLALAGAPGFGFRAIVVAIWGLLFLVHVPLSIRRNHAVIRAVEARATGDSAAAPAGPPVAAASTTASSAPRESDSSTARG
jgi:phosphatidylglycerophosphate synthase